jgi:predicted nucleic acid-binding protein
LLRGHPSVSRHAQAEPELRIAWVTYAELLAGAHVRPRPGPALEAVRAFVRSVGVGWPDAETCEEYARLQSALRGAGLPIPTNDVWIAALAAQHGFTLVTSDAHFDRVPGLLREDWMA